MLQKFLQYLCSPEIITRAQSINTICYIWMEMFQYDTDKIIDECSKQEFIFDERNFLTCDPRREITDVDESFILPESGCRTIMSIVVAIQALDNKIDSIDMINNFLLRQALETEEIVVTSSSFQIFHLIPDNMLTPQQRIGDLDPFILSMGLTVGTISQHAIETLGPPRSEHFIGVIKQGDAYSLFQAYYLNYTYSQWCDFDTPLQRMIINPDLKINPAWQLELVESPYRKIMNKKEIANFYTDLMSLTQPSDHIETFARISSVVYTKDDIGKCYRIYSHKID